MISYITRDNANWMIYVAVLFNDVEALCYIIMAYDIDRTIGIYAASLFRRHGIIDLYIREEWLPVNLIILYARDYVKNKGLICTPDPDLLLECIHNNNTVMILDLLKVGTKVDSRHLNASLSNKKLICLFLNHGYKYTATQAISVHNYDLLTCVNSITKDDLHYALLYGEYDELRYLHRFKVEYDKNINTTNIHAIKLYNLTVNKNIIRLAICENKVQILEEYYNKVDLTKADKDELLHTAASYSKSCYKFIRKHS